MDWNILLENLTNTGIGVALYICAYLANMAFSLYYNIKILRQPYDPEKLKNSLIKVGTFAIGTFLLCVTVTTIPQFSNAVGFEIPTEYSEVFADLAIIGVFLYTACRYAFEAFSKMKAILEASKTSISE